MTEAGFEAGLAGVMGWPVAHSRSPRLHRHWLDRYGIAGAYLPLAVAPDRLGDAMAGLSALGFRGCNITVPHKEAAVRYLHTASDTVRRLGAVNTVIVGSDGLLHGDNTDGFGFMETLRDNAPQWIDLAGRGRPVVVIGAGGAARAIVGALADAGVERIAIVNRTRSKAEAVAAMIDANPTRPACSACRVTTHDLTVLEAPDGPMADASLVINTSVLGMAGQPPLHLPLDHLPTDAVVADIVYSPLMTDLLVRAAARGNPVVTGIGMLLHQAAPGFRAWFGVQPVVDDALARAVLGPPTGPVMSIRAGTRAP